MIERGRRTQLVTLALAAAFAAGCGRDGYDARDPSSPPAAAATSLDGLRAKLEGWRRKHNDLNTLLVTLDRDRENLLDRLETLSGDAGELATGPVAQALSEEFRHLERQRAECRRKRDEYDVAIASTESRLRTLERSEAAERAGVADADVAELARVTLELEAKLSSDDPISDVASSLDDAVARELRIRREQRSARTIETKDPAPPLPAVVHIHLEPADAVLQTEGPSAALSGSGNERVIVVEVQDKPLKLSAIAEGREAYRTELLLRPGESRQLSISLAPSANPSNSPATRDNRINEAVNTTTWTELSATGSNAKWANLSSDGGLGWSFNPGDKVGGELRTTEVPGKKSGATEVPGKQDLRTVESYGDFEFRCEFWLPEGANSGVYLRGRYELQLLDDPAYPTIPPNSRCGSVYGVIAPSGRYYAGASQWNELYVRLEKQEITASLNARVLFSRQPLRESTRGALYKNAGNVGPIILQHHGDGVRFRNVQIRPIQEQRFSPFPETTDPLPPVAGGDEEARATDMEAIQGEWKCIAGEENGEPQDQSKLAQDHRRVVIEGSSLTMQRAGASWVGKFEIDAASGRFDWVGKRVPENNLVEWVGIYELREDTLKLCFIFDRDGKAKRPTEFKSLPPAQPGLAHAFYTFKRHND